MAEIGQECTVAARKEAMPNHCLDCDIPVVRVIKGGCEKQRTALAERQRIPHHSVARA